MIVYRSGVDWQSLNDPTPPPTNLTSFLPPETVTAVALEFVRSHSLLPEPVVAHEFPSYDDRYTVHVAFAPSGLRLTGIGEGPGVTMQLDGDGRVTEARIIPASFVVVETAVIQPLSEIYPAFLQGAAQDVYFDERAQLAGSESIDPMRFQAHSLPYGDQGDRAELVYVPRPNASPTPPPTRTPLGQTGIVPQSLRIVPPLLVDEGNGRLYTNAAVNGITPRSAWMR